ncbi:MAG: glycoside hydrolase family 127 protein [Planctomycetia bacterium]|nr:glycoside hydrolase family 127 protein [Planctomycetia bacterium]
MKQKLSFISILSFDWLATMLLTTILTIILSIGTQSSINAEELKRTFNAVPFTEVHLNDSFWAPRIEANRVVSVPHNIDWCENQTGRINNFRIAAGEKEGEFSGIYFDDSDVYKILEGFAYSLAAHPDADLKKVADSWIDLFEKSQEDDGYLMTYFKLVKPEEKWTNLASMHELYCAGHMAEAAVAYKRATGDDKFLNVNRRLIDLICKRYGNGEDQLKNVAGHEEIELALVKLYELTGERKYLEQAKFFVDCRGVAEGREKGLFGDYCQDHMPVREQSEIVGHAVRAMYLYSGATDVAGYYQDEALMNAMKRLWNNVVYRKMYLTGGIGSHASNEGFGEAFFLPNQTAYAETCAAIGLILWAHRMNLATGEAKYADVMEQAMYNGMLSGYGMNGDSYFYVNPLASKGNHHRQPFFGCACCPSNVIRVIASLPGYVYATEQSEERQKAGLEGDDVIVVNMFVQGKATIELADKIVEIEQKTNYPFDGKVKIIVKGKFKEGIDSDKASEDINVKIRIPGWVSKMSYPDEKKPEGIFFPISSTDKELQKGYANSQNFVNATNVECRAFEMPVVRMIANPNVKDDNGRVALKRGPLVYCFEQCDNDVPVDRIILPKDPEFKVEMRDNFISSENDNDATKNSPMRTVAVITCKDIKGRTLTAVPYYSWDNRAAGKMAVWVRQVGLNAETDSNWTGSDGEPILYKPLDESLLTDELPTIEQTAQFGASHQADAHSSFDGTDPNVQPKNSCDHDIPRATFWDHKGTAEWFEYDFFEPKTISKTTVYWFDDTGIGQCRVPKSWSIVYQEKEGGEWKEVETADAYSVEADKEITVQFKPVKATKIRLNVQLQENVSGGILKWNVQ